MKGNDMIGKLPHERRIVEAPCLRPLRKQCSIGKAAHLQKPIDRFSVAIEVQAARRILGYRANRQVEFRRGPAIKP